MYSTYVPCVIATLAIPGSYCVPMATLFLNHLELFIQLVRVHQALEMDGTAHANSVYFGGYLGDECSARVAHQTHGEVSPGTEEEHNTRRVTQIP